MPINESRVVDAAGLSPRHQSSVVSGMMFFSSSSPPTLRLDDIALWMLLDAIGRQFHSFHSSRRSTIGPYGGAALLRCFSR